MKGLISKPHLSKLKNQIKEWVYMYQWIGVKRRQKNKKTKLNEKQATSTTTLDEDRYYKRRVSAAH